MDTWWSSNLKVEVHEQISREIQRNYESCTNRRFRGRTSKIFKEEFINESKIYPEQATKLKNLEKKTLRSLLNFAFPTLLFEGIPSFSSLQ